MHDARVNALFTDLCPCILSWLVEIIQNIPQHSLMDSTYSAQARKKAAKYSDRRSKPNITDSAVSKLRSPVELMRKQGLI